MTESPIYSVRTEEEVAREILAGSDISSLPWDYPLDQLASDRMKDLAEASARIERLAAALEPFAKAGTMEIKGNGMANVLLFISDIEAARAALSGTEPTP